MLFSVQQKWTHIHTVSTAAAAAAVCVCVCVFVFVFVCVCDFRPHGSCTRMKLVMVGFRVVLKSG